MCQIEIVLFEEVGAWWILQGIQGSGKTRRKSVPTLDAALSFLADPYIDDDEDDDDTLSSESQK